MKRVLLALAVVVLVAATPEEALPGLEADGYYIEPGSSVSEQVVSDAVFEGRADGGRLYFVVLAEEPPGGAPTFSDSVLDLLGVEGYVVTVSPETVGWAGEGFWTQEEMDDALSVSLDGASDDEVVELFISELTGVSQGSTGGSSGSDGGSSDSSGGGISIAWILVAGVVGVAIWMFVSRRSSARRTAQRLDEIRHVARGKLDEIANDILEMENEVAVSDNAEVQEHYQRASAMYTKATEDNQRATSIREMLDVSEELDLAIWELDCAEALLDGKPKPPKPEPPAVPAPPLPPPPTPIPEGGGEMPPVPGTVDQYDRRPQRQSSGTSDLMTMLMTMMAMGSMRGGGGFGGFGGWGGGSGGGSGMGGGGFRTGGGGGRMRGGGRRG